MLIILDFFDPPTPQNLKKVKFGEIAEQKKGSFCRRSQLRKHTMNINCTLATENFGIQRFECTYNHVVTPNELGDILCGILESMRTITDLKPWLQHNTTVTIPRIRSHRF